MKKILRVGFKYLNRFGHEVEIEKREHDCFFDKEGVRYGLVGVVIDKGASWDLVSYAKGFPKLIMKLNVPVAHTGPSDNFHSYQHEAREVVVRYIEKVPLGLGSTKKFSYAAHYELPSEYKFDEYYPSQVDGALKTAYIDRKTTKFNPKNFTFDASGIAMILPGNVESLSWSLY